MTGKRSMVTLRFNVFPSTFAGVTVINSGSSWLMRIKTMEMLISIRVRHLIKKSSTRNASMLHRSVGPLLIVGWI